MLERLFKEVKRRMTKVVGVFPNETSAATTLVTEIALRSSEERALKRYLTMDPLEVVEKPEPQLRDVEPPWKNKRQSSYKILLS